MSVLQGKKWFLPTPDFPLGKIRLLTSEYGHAGQRNIAHRNAPDVWCRSSDALTGDHRGFVAFQSDGDPCGLWVNLEHPLSWCGPLERKSLKSARIEGIRELIEKAASKPDAVHLTLQFKRPLPTEAYLPTVHHFVRCLNRDLFGKRWAEHSRHLSGIAIHELGWKSQVRAGHPHFHFVLYPSVWDVESVGRSFFDALTDAAKRAASRLVWPISEFEKCHAPISNSRLVCVTRVDSPKELARYLTKQENSLSPEDVGTHLAFLGSGGVIGFDRHRLRPWPT